MWEYARRIFESKKPPSKPLHFIITICHVVISYSYRIILCTVLHATDPLVHVCQLLENIQHVLFVGDLQTAAVCSLAIIIQ